MDVHKAIFAENLNNLMAKYSKTQNDLVNDLGFKQATLSDWLNGKKFPRIDKIEALANYFLVKKTDLLEKKVDALSFYEVSEQEKELIEKYRALDERGKKAIDDNLAREYEFAKSN